jgi:enoyl-CoA hydratase/carnithine racemase
VSGIQNLVPQFSDYQDLFGCARLSRDDDGVLLVQLHTDGDELIMTGQAFREFSALISYVGRDPENRVVILTGSGANFMDKTGYSNIKLTPKQFADTHIVTRRIMTTLLDIEAPIIAAINGPCTLHAEWALLSDIVLAADNAFFQDRTHIVSDKHGIAPGDGVHVFWPMMLGLTRGRYFLLTGQKISAAEGLTLGIVNEVLPKDQLLDRAFELARQLATVPALSLRFTRSMTLQDVRRRMLDDLGYGLALEGLDSAYQWMQTYATEALANVETPAPS